MPFPHTNSNNHDRNPECIESIADINRRVIDMEMWQERQNGSLQRMTEVLHNFGERIAGMDEKLSQLLVRQREDRDEMHKLKSDPNLQLVIPPKEERPALDGKSGFLREMIRRYPLGSGLILGLVLATLLVLGSDWLRSTLSTVVQHRYGTPAPQHTPTALPGR